MRRRIRRAAGIAMLAGAGCAAIIAACDFEAPNHPLDSPDAASVFDAEVDADIPPAEPCQDLVSTCVGNGERLRACKTQGQLPEESVCAFGCVDAPTPHCQLIKPSGGAVTDVDLDPNGPTAAMLTDKSFTVTGSLTFNTDTGEIKIGGGVVRNAGVGIVSGIDFQTRGAVGVFRFHKLELKGSIGGQQVFAIGAKALAIVSLTTIDVSDAAAISVQGDCSSVNAGPGGGIGGQAQQAGQGSGAGQPGAANNNTCTGGGGGAYGESGGNGGGNNNSGGAPSGTSTITTLLGGAGGGGGGGNQGGSGGGGGGALQMVANERIHLAGGFFSVSINAGGCGGNAAAANNCGGGGGAGGTILLESDRIDLESSYVTANGGGGGGASSGGNGGDGALNLRAAGGFAGNPSLAQNDEGGSGGAGGRGDGSTNNDTAQNGGVQSNRGGGGGGGAGRIRLNTKSGTVGQNMSTLSPSQGESNATTVGTVTLQ